jgi:crotonobetainyl-CoA:carnitine CoA-transferase CaiB-like acyl-CoA transferase
MASSPLSGIRILDLSRLLPGPYCTLLLADLGAEVVKIETPLVGDYARTIAPDSGGEAVFGAVNRNKKSVALNYRHPRGREVLLRLVREADVFVETFRPGATRRWKIDYEAVRTINTRIIYCSLSGYGQDGPYANRAGHDLNYIALGGLLALNGVAGGPPIPPGVQIADLAGGMLAAMSILAALTGRERSGQGAYLDVAMLDVVISWIAPVAGAQFLGTGKNPERGQMPLSGGFPCYNVYETADEKFISLGALEPHFWTAFCAAVERNDLVGRQFDADATPLVAAILSERTRDEWLLRFHEVDACVEPVNALDEMMQDPQVRHRGLVRGTGSAQQFGSPFRFTGRPPESSAPTLGEHTRQVLTQAGMDDQELQELAAAGVIKTT